MVQIGPRNLEEALARYTEPSLDTGVATGGTNTTCVDAGKSWEVNHWAGGDIHIVKAGVKYVRTIVSNTADTITHAALPGVIAVAAGDIYAIREEATTVVSVPQLAPLEKAAEHNTAEVAGADILAAALAPTNTPCRFRVIAAFNAAGVLSVTITRAGNTQVTTFNNGVPLNVNSLYMFDHLVHAGDTINYRYSVNAQMLVMRVQEIVAAA